MVLSVMKRKWLAAAAVCLLLCLAAGAVLLSAAISPERIRPEIEEAISRYFSTAAVVEGASFHLLSETRLEKVVIAHDSGSAEGSVTNRVVLSGVRLLHAKLPLLSGTYRLQQIHVESLAVRLEGGVRKWLAKIGADANGSGQMPEIHVADAEVELFLPGWEAPLVFKDFRFLGKPSGKGGGGRGFHGEGVVTGGEVLLPGWPEALSHKAARFVFAEKTVLLRDAGLSGAGGCIEIPAAGLRWESRVLQDIWVRAAAHAVSLPSLSSSPLTRLYPKYWPAQFVSGRAGGDLYLNWKRGQGAKYRLELAVEAASGSAPVPGWDFSGLHARLGYSSTGRLEIRDAHANILGGAMEAEGALRLTGHGVEDPSLTIEGTGITHVEPLLALSPESVREFAERSDPVEPLVSGTLGIRSTGMRLALSVSAKRALLPGLSLLLSSPRLDLSWASAEGRIDFRNAQAEWRKTLLQAEGSVVLSQAPHIDFSVSGTGLPVDSSLLEQLGVDLKGWEPAGLCDVEIRARDWRPGAKEDAGWLDGMYIEAFLRQGALSHLSLGRIAEDLAGRIRVSRKGMRVSDMSGRLFGIDVAASGRLPAAREQEPFRILLSAENIAFHQGLFDRLPIDPAFSKLGISGQCSAVCEITEVPDNRGGYGATARISFHEIRLQQGKDRVSASGSARLRLLKETGGEPEIEGSLHLEHLEHPFLTADRVQSDFTFQEGRLMAEEMRFFAYGGKIRVSRAELDTGKGLWRAKMMLSRIDLESLVETLDLKGRKPPSGMLGGHIEISGQGFDAEALTGEGSIKIGGEHLYSFPMLVAVFNVLDFQIPRQSPVTEAYGDFHIEGGVLHIDDLLFSGGTVPAYLQGTIGIAEKGGLSEKPIRLIATVAKKEGILDQIPLINWAKHYTLDFFRRLVFQAMIEGTIGDYEVTTITSPLTDPIRKMFQLIEKITPSPP
jgi:hypothetical protein